MNILRPRNFRGNGVHVWSARFSHSPSLDASLSHEERTRLSGMPLEKRRNEFVRGRFGLRRVTSIYLEIPEENVKIAIDQNGKPRLDHGGASLEVSLSHAEERIVYAFSPDTAVGIDVERRRVMDVNRLAKEHFSPRECKEMEALTTERAQLDFFFDLWTRKEAVSKFLGLGLRAPFSEIEISGDDVTYRDETIATRGFDWDDFRIAVACDRASAADIHWKGSLLS